MAQHLTKTLNIVVSLNKEKPSNQTKKALLYCIDLYVYFKDK